MSPTLVLNTCLEHDACDCFMSHISIYDYLIYGPNELSVEGIYRIDLDSVVYLSIFKLRRKRTSLTPPLILYIDMYLFICK